MIVGGAYEVNRVDTNNLIAEEIEELYLVDRCIVERYGFLKRFRGVSEYKDLFLSMFIGNDNDLFIIKNHSLTCGILSFMKSTDWSGKERYELSIRLCDLVISKHLIECLDRFVYKKLIEYNRFAIITYNNELEALMEKYSAAIDKKSNTYTLNKEDIDIDLLNKSINDYQIKNNDLDMIYTDIISEEYIEQYCQLFMETMKDMPDREEEGYVEYVINPEKQRKYNEANHETNNAHHCFMIFNKDNEMVAKSNVSVNNNDPRFPYQFMIGVKGQYRGRSLGKWLYATMYKKLLEDVVFEKVLVHHHPKNKPAIDISEWIGYEFSYLEVTHLVCN